MTTKTDQLLAIRIYDTTSKHFLSETEIDNDFRTHLLSCETCRKQFSTILQTIGQQISTVEGVRAIDGTHDANNPREEFRH